MKPFYLPAGRCRAVARACALLVCSYLFSSSQLNAQTVLSTQSISATTASGGNTQSMASAVDEVTGDIYQVGILRATADLDPGAGVSWFISNGAEDCYIAKYSSTGAFLWGHSFGGGGADVISNVLIDVFGNIIVSGSFSNTVDFDPGPGVTKLTSAGNTDIFFAKFSPAGDLLFVKTMGGITNDSPGGISLDGAGHIYMTGTMTSASMDVDPGPGVVTLTKQGTGSNGFVARYDNNGNYLWAFGLGSTATSSQINCARVEVAVGGAMYITGYITNGPYDFNPGAGVNNLTTATNDTDIFLAKYDLNGNYVWSFKVGGSSGDFAYGMDSDGSGNIYLTGTYNVSANFNPAGTYTLTAAATTGTDVFLAKYSPAGGFLWAIGIGGTNNEYGTCVKVDAANNPIVSGYFGGTVNFNRAGTAANLTAQSTDGFVAKYTAAGVYSWARRYGGATDDRVAAITTDPGNNVYVDGYFSGTANFNHAGTYNMSGPGSQYVPFNVKLNNAGNFISAFSANIPLNATSNNHAAGTWIDASNNYYVTGYFGRTVDFDPGPGVTSLTAVGYTDCFIAKYNASGELQFVRSIGNTSNTAGKSICTDAAGNIYVTGTYTGTIDANPGAGIANLPAFGYADIFLLKLNSSGNYVSAISFGGPNSDAVNGMTIDNTGNIYLTGSFSSPGGTPIDFDPGAGVANRTTRNNSTDAYVVKYNSSLGYVFASVLGGTSTENGVAIAVDATGNVYSTGSFGGTADLDPGAAEANLVSAGSNDIYVSKLDANGNYLNAFRIGSTTAEVGNALAVDATGNLYIAGQFAGTVDFDPGTGLASLISAGALDAFVAKYDGDGNYINAVSFGGAGNDMAQLLKLDARGNVYTAGVYASTELSFNLAGTTQTFFNEGNNDVFMAVFNPSLVYQGGRSVGGGQNDAVGGLLLDAGDNILLAGSFNGVATIDNLSGASAFPFRSLNASDIFLASFEMMSMLPIKLESFTAVQQQAQVLTKWTVSSQVNNEYFTVERSADGSQFTALGRVAGCVDCQTRMDYQFIDRQPLTGWSYYRLKQTDLDGRSSYSRIVRVNYNDTKGQLALYPTVTDNAFTLSYNNKTNNNQQATIRVFNTAGNTVHVLNVVLKPGMNTVPMTLAKLPAGTYYTSLIINQSKAVHTATVIKQR